MAFLACIEHLFYRIENQKKQILGLPEDLSKLIFSLLTISEISRFGRTCKEWNDYTRLDLRLLKKEAIKLQQRCEDSCLIRAYETNRYINYIFACHWQDDKIVV